MGRCVMMVLAVVVLMAGYAAAEEKPAPAKPLAVVEVEAFKLTKATVKEVKEASGGKVVVLNDETGQAEYTVPELKAGKYEVVVYGLAPSDKEDAFYVKVADQPEERRFIKDAGKITDSDPVAFTVEKDGPCKILLTFGEENVQFDKIEIRLVK